MASSSFMKSRVSLTEGPIFKNLLIFSLPVLLGTIVTQMYNVADSVIVGRFVDSDALAAVSAASPVMSFINMFMIGMATGSSVVVAQRAGAGDREGLQKAIGSIGCMTLLIGVFVTLLGLLASAPLLRLLDTPEEIFRDAQWYLLVIYLGTTGNMVYQMANGALRGMGDSTWPFLLLLICSVLNVILDLAAVLVFHMGVIGVAIATSLSQLVSAIGAVCRMNRGSYGLKIDRSTLRFSKQETGDIVRIGLPAAIQNVGNAIANLCIQSSVNYFGTDFIAANSIVTKVDEFINIPVVALSTALCTFVGQNMGRFDMKRIRRGINYSILFLSALGAFLCGGLILLRNVFPYVFTTETRVAEYAAAGLFIMSFQCFFHGTDRCLVNAMRGAGKSVVPMITAQFGAFSRIPLAYFLGVRMNSWRGIFYALLIASFLRSAAIAVYYYGGGWKKAVRRFEEKRKNTEGARA